MIGISKIRSAALHISDQAVITMVAYRMFASIAYTAFCESANIYYSVKAETPYTLNPFGWLETELAATKKSAGHAFNRTTEMMGEASIDIVATYIASDAMSGEKLQNFLESRTWE